MANEGKYLNLKPHVTSWSIYNVNGPYVTSSRIGTLAPAQFGGLSYQILEDKGGYVYIIQTESFGRVAIWAGDSDSTFTSSPAYTNGASAPTGGTGLYVNLSPQVTSWSIYNVNGPYVTDSRIGALAPAQFGGLSYEIQGEKGNNVYLIQTESFGLVAIWAGDSDSTFTSVPIYLDPVNGGQGGGTTAGTGQYLNLHPHVASWSIYNVNGPYVTASRIGAVAPAQYGGLSYAILGNPTTDVYIIQTENFGRVAIWAGDSDSSITGNPTYGAGSYTGSSSDGTYLNLSPAVDSWSVYNVNGPYVTTSRIGALAPAQYGGLSYAILGNPTTDVYIIQTESFGRVAIWAGDSDSSITENPTYGTGSYTGGSSDGTYLNLSPAVDSWSIYNVNGPYVTTSRIGALAPSQFGGLSYRILESKGNSVYVIQTESFGKVAIWAGDSDSTFTSYPTYGNTSTAPSPGGILSGINFDDAPVSIQTRATWRANPVQPAGMDGNLSTIKYIVIHHTAGAQPQVGTDYEVMRGIQNYHQSLGWGDIGYHFCIGQQGTVMEGRSLPQVGAHVGKPHNFDSIGVSLFGDFSYVKPGDTQLKKLVPLLKYLCERYNISPDNILGHRDMDSNYGATACPGNYFYNATNQLQEIRNAVQEQLRLKDSLSLSEKKQQLLEKMRTYFQGIPFFQDVPFNLTMWEQEGSFPISGNITMKVKLSFGTESNSPIANLINVNITEPQIKLEGPYFDLVREQKVDDIEFYNAKEAMEQLAEKLKGHGNVALSMGVSGDKILFNYVVNFNSMTLSDGSILASSCRITLEIDNNTFMTPDSYPVKVPNEEVALNIRAMDPQLAVGLATATAFLLIVAVMGTGGAGAAAGAVAVYLFLG
ncbi:peptidoglycan recognition family protein [Streptococcus parasuis]|uniref:peptidoglycan recognition protein family protein n=1 Tax=Streptococcus parasuis TaxID=1501662 RepID=UPI002899698F|nr:peptidoglycan recognition family protein [Streptococcus parasuis]